MSDDNPSDAPPSNRRRESRRLSCIPAYVETKKSSRHLALIRDISTVGARLLVREPWRVGEAVQLSLYLSEDPDGAKPARGRVVRAEPHTGVRDVWSYQIAVEFDESIAEYSAEIHAIAEKQEKLGLFK